MNCPIFPDGGRLRFPDWGAVAPCPPLALHLVWISDEILLVVYDILHETHLELNNVLSVELIIHA